MNHTNRNWPSVPSGPGVSTYSSGLSNDGAEGAKNPWVRTGCYWKLKIGTYNTRSLSSDDRIIELESELSKINFDIIGLSETRRKGEGCITLNNSGHRLFYRGDNTCQRGVGFLVHKSLAGNITSFKGVSDRVAQLTLKINKKYNLNIIQAYLPTTSHPDEVVDSTYEDIENLLRESRAQMNIIMGDFNAKIGKKDNTDVETCTGPFGLGNRNSRGTMLIDFCERHRLKIMNSFFKKKPSRRWTWIAPNITTKNEIDFIITDKPKLFTDTSVLNSFNTGSDHRLLRASVTINTKFDRSKMVKGNKKPDYSNLHAKSSEFQLKLTNKFALLDSNDDLDIYQENIANTILQTAFEIAGTAKETKPEKLTAETKQLQEKRRKMKRDGCNLRSIAYSEVCKAIRHRMAHEIQN